MPSPRVASILLKIDQLLGKQLEEPTPEPKPPADTAREKAIVDQMAEIRRHLQRTGAAFGAGTTLLLAGLGYAQLHEVFPLPARSEVRTGLAAALGAALALGGAVILAGAFFRAQRRILITPAREDADIKGDDAKIKSHFYQLVATEESAPSVEALELRARRFERMARMTSDEGVRNDLEKEAARVTGAYRWAMILSAGRILERRSRKASAHSVFWALVTALGIALVFGAADYSKGERDKIALFKSCEEARKLGADEACDSVRAAPTAEETRQQAAKQKAMKRAEATALAQARRTFRNTPGPSLARLEACLKVLSGRSRK